MNTICVALQNVKYMRILNIMYFTGKHITFYYLYIHII